MFRVVIEGGPQPAPRYNLKDGVPVSLGAGEGDDLQVLAEPLVEGHLTLRAEGHAVHVDVREGAPPVGLEGREGGSFTLKSGDCLDLGGLRLTFVYVVFTLGDGRRRTSRMQHLTTLAVGAVLVLEIGFIIWFSLIKTSKQGLPETLESAAASDPVPVPSPEKPGVSMPALFFDAVDSMVERDNQGIFDILQVRAGVGSRRDLSQREQESLSLEMLWERESGDQGWDELDEFSPLKKQELNAEEIREPLVSTLLLPTTAVDGPDLSTHRIRASISLSVGGQVIDQRMVLFEPSDSFE